MSYHRATVLPHVQPMRNFAEAYDPYTQQRRYVVPPQPPRLAQRAIGSYSGALGDSGDGLGSTLVVL